ncbi:hypothetical protein RJ640_008864 [Escallonia rubra]|uniref:Rad21/Rec8-like protein N-terminal domain-containing protein n=1 Tax=Escallonia rubra TaxID=112253 RepID=A0AA88QI94_9ASTE|nr:hypothetical protein RJ640_008864 [Escallonia rubra]
MVPTTKGSFTINSVVNKGMMFNEKEYILYTKKSIALIMSGHLLLGVVRIYEKKVEYLHEDCRVVWISLKNAYAPAGVNLPEDATHAPFHSVTLPEKFELDAFDLDDYQEDSHPSISEDTTRETEMPNRNIPDIEVMRNVLDDLHSRNVSLWIDHKNDILEPDSDLVQQLMKYKDNYTPGVEEMLVPGEPSQQHQEPPSGEPENFDSGLLYGGVSSELAIRSTPHVEQPQAKPRKRKQLYDEKTVLSYEFLRKMIDDSNDLLRAERCLPVSDLGVWKLNKRLKMDALFFDPLLTGELVFSLDFLRACVLVSGTDHTTDSIICTGLCADLSNIYKKDFISAKPRSVSSKETRPEPIECIQNYEGSVGIDVFPEPLRRPNRSMPSSPAYDDIIGSHSDQVGTLGLAASNGLPGSVVETPELMNSSEGDLSFLEQDDNTGAGSPEVDYILRKHNGTPEVDTLSVRTRAVAQFLKAKALVTPITRGANGDLSLTNILDGNRRRLCARMVFETMVFKNMGFVDLQQEEPYGDIILKATLKLTKRVFKTSHRSSWKLTAAPSGPSSCGDRGVGWCGGGWRRWRRGFDGGDDRVAYASDDLGRRILVVVVVIEVQVPGIIVFRMWSSLEFGRDGDGTPTELKFDEAMLSEPGAIGIGAMIRDG